MKNEFGYIDEKTFKECDTEKQMFSTISIDDEGIEFKTNGINKMSVFDSDKMPKAIYAVNSRLEAITALRLRPESCNFTAISSSVIKSDMYFIKQGTLTEGEKIKHFTTETKIKEIYYYSDSLSKIFLNNSFVSSCKLKNNTLKSVKIYGKKCNAEKLGDYILLDGNKVEVLLKCDFKYNHQYSGCERVEIKDNSYLKLRFKKGIVFSEAYKFILLLDSVVYLMTFMKRRHKNIIIKDFKKDSYLCIDKRKDSEERKVEWRNFLICERKDAKKEFVNLFKNMYSLNEDAKNAMFPFLEFDSKQTSLEIKFLEYYKALEYIEYKENLKKGKGKNPTFLVQVLKNNHDLKQRFFGNQAEKDIEEEIRSLRNFYSHTGYYLKELPIPTNKPKRIKVIDTKWLYDVLEYLKVQTYIEFYKICGINADWDKIINNL